jgi:DNA-binding phage protein
MVKTKTSRYDVAEHLRTPEEMSAYLEASIEEANGDAPFFGEGTRRYRESEGYESNCSGDGPLSRESLQVAVL